MEPIAESDRLDHKAAKEEMPAPEAFGMSSDSVDLVSFTEFIDPPDASITELSADGDEKDQAISWGATSLAAC